MPHSDLIDHSPQHPVPAPPVATATNLILIDNYDSFTWNVYQYLVLEGATVQVFRNDEISLQDLISKNPTQLVFSPGPGHPDTETGISNDAIKHFAGKIPILGVCLGEQCIYSVFGGRVEVTGEILHGKTSILKHDAKGVYEGIPQDIPVTRYHSLAGTHPTLPDCLEVSSWASKGTDEGRGVIMGVRHKEYVVEGVQFHPESILTAQGRKMLRNFLRMQGGTWAENERLSKDADTTPNHPNGVNGVNAASSTTSNDKQLNGEKKSILETIFEERKRAVAAQKDIPSQRPSDLQAAYDFNLAPPQIDFTERLKQSPFKLSLMAEIKRASPSKGIISLGACAPAQAKSYALAGASVISVLTEPEWFKGSMDDLRSVRQILDGMPNRPAVLRKEFVFDEYQILEARLGGADTVLLIVKMLDETTLKRLYHYSQSLGMEPLVEVNNIEEMEIAVRLGSKVIGVNNRNLTNFEVDLETTSRLMDTVPESTIVCALSGISGPKDVEPYQKSGVGAVLVGEALMRAHNAGEFARELLGGDAPTTQRSTHPELLVKICGTRTPQAAAAAIESGADLIGMILADKRRRFVPEDIAVEISNIVHNTYKDRQSFSRKSKPTPTASEYFEHTSSNYMASRHRALLVGVFQNQSLDRILDLVKLLDLDLVQLHGSEPVEWASLIPVPVIRAFKPGDPGIGTRRYHAMPLLDAGAGGHGQSLTSESLVETLAKDVDLKTFLAGGLDSNTVADKIAGLGPLANKVVGVDVSSGVEDNGEQSIEKIREFIRAAKAISRSSS